MTKKILLPVLFLTFLFSTFTFGMFMLPTPVPVDRLIKNTTAYINEHPENYQHKLDYWNGFSR